MLINQPRSSIANVERVHSDTATQPIINVSPSGGQYTTISEAIRSAVPKTRINVHPGHYYEGFIINKQLEIIGSGPKEQIIVESTGTSCIKMQTDDALVQDLTLRCHSTDPASQIHAVDIPKGRLALRGCDITSSTGACIVVRGPSAYSEIQSCWLHGAGTSGLFIKEHAQGTIESCDIFGNGFPSISIKDYANLVIRKCKIYRGQSHGILVWENAYGTIEDCDIYENAKEGVKAKDARTVTVKKCRIYNNTQQQEWVYQNGMGNTRYPSAPQTYSVHNQERIPEVRSSPISTSIEYTSDKVVYQTEKRSSLLDLILHPFRSFTKRNKV
jgi:parallel beta-helix repeat protein